MPRLIPIYSADGALQDKVTEERLERLHSLGLIARVIRHRKGHVNRAVMFRRSAEGRSPHLSDYLGTRYSYREHLDSGHIAWSLKQLGHGNELRPIFLQVVTDCLAAPRGEVVARR